MKGYKFSLIEQENHETACKMFCSISFVEGEFNCLMINCCNCLLNGLRKYLI